MGDGSTVTCTSRGTRYEASYGMRASPDCGHTFIRTSAAAPDRKFAVKATSTWTVDWQGAGQHGQLTEMRETQVPVSVGEVQVVG
ncbi:hypothetical protein LKL35_36600 [Streptomyces sp. ET3-23]|uniref:hypothetical protein n=1 Tax=Streptomyces sp. ET3-23 TaxID=2885643 RepID=UPI001D11C5A3|nr:hypothetical protein [Streptomyces sp. ET3-23]MCC2280850.1 hypothetical protein [Streptomyces sp. ET3-23]